MRAASCLLDITSIRLKAMGKTERGYAYKCNYVDPPLVEYRSIQLRAEGKQKWAIYH